MSGINILFLDNFRILPIWELQAICLLLIVMTPILIYFHYDDYHRKQLPKSEREKLDKERRRTNYYVYRYTLLTLWFMVIIWLIILSVNE